MYTISIITITYNDLHGLKNTINSIDKNYNIHNSYINHVIIDGNSSDGTLIYLNHLKINRKIQTTIISESDLGIYDAMNKGVFNSNSDFVIFINSGDILLETFFNNEIYELLNKNITQSNSAGFANNCLYNFNGKKIKILSRNIDITQPRMPSLHQGIIYKRSILINIPYSINFKICGDFDNICKIIKKYKFDTSNITISELNAGGVSTLQPFKLAKESFYIYKMHFSPNFINCIFFILKISISLFAVQLLYFYYNRNKF